MACPGQFASWRALGREATRLCEPSAQGRPPLLGCCPVHPALVDDQSNEVPVTTIIPSFPCGRRRPPRRPGRRDTVEAWLQDYATSRDPSCGADHPGLPGRGRPAGPGGSATAAGPAPRTWSRPLGRADRRRRPLRPRLRHPVRSLRGGLCGRRAEARHLRDTSWRLHVSRPLKEQALRLCRAADELYQRLGRSPTTAELAEQLDMDEAEVLTGWRPGQPP